MSVYRLHYFDFPGRAEPARLLFNAASVNFEDVRYTEAKWPAFKPKTPFGMLPVLEIDGKMYGESNAIYRYLASEFNLYGKNNTEKLRIDVIMELQRELEAPIIDAFFTEGQEEAKKKELVEKLYNEVLPPYYSNNEKLMTDSSGYFVGNTLSVADILVYDITNFFMKMRNGENIIASYPKLIANRKLVESNTGIAAYTKKQT